MKHRPTTMASEVGNDQRCSCLAKRWGWVVTLATYLVEVTCIGFLYTYGILSVAFQEEFNSTVTETAWVATINPFCACIFAFFAEVLIGKFGHRVVGMLGIVTVFIACILSSFMPALWPLYITFGVLYGIGTSLAYASSLYLIIAYFPVKNCTRATVLSSTGSPSGMLVLNPLILRLVTAVGWRNTMRIMGMVILLIGFACAMTLVQPGNVSFGKRKRSKPTPAPVQDSEDSPLRSDSKSEKNEKEMTEASLTCESHISNCNGKQQVTHESSHEYRKKLQIFCFPEYLIFLVATVLSQMSMTFFLFYWVKFMLVIGFEESTAALAMTVMGASKICGQLLLAAVTDHLPFAKIYVMSSAILIGIPVMVSLFYIKSLAAVFGVTAVTGLVLMSVLDSIPPSLCQEVFGTKYGTTPTSIMMAAIATGFLLGTLVGLSVDKTGSFQSGIYACIAANVAAVLLFLAIPLYQRMFAKSRYIMCDRLNKEKVKPEKLDENDDDPNDSNENNPDESDNEGENNSNDVGGPFIVQQESCV